MRTSKTLLAAAFLASALPVQAQDTLTKQYDDGGIYEGSFKDGVQHGKGTYRQPNGYEYTGDWVDGEIRGMGVARFPDGSVYEGTFANGGPHGQGKITFADGGSYEGDWQNGKISGNGIAILQLLVYGYLGG